MDRSEDWPSRRPSSSLMDYTSTSAEDTGLARTHSQSHNNHFFTSRHGRAPTTTRPTHITPTTSLSSVPTMPVSIPIPSNPSVIPGNTLPSAPASPPTPAPSPTPMQNSVDWTNADENEDIGELDLDAVRLTSTEHGSASSSTRGFRLGYRHIRATFADMSNDERQRMLSELLNMCDGKMLGFVANFVGPRLKRDPFSVLPNELCLRILTFIDDAKTLARSSQVSKRWRELVSDDMAWKSLCEKHAYRRLSDDGRSSSSRPRNIPHADSSSYEQKLHHPYGYVNLAQGNSLTGMSSSAPDLSRRTSAHAAAAAATASVLPPTLSARATTSGSVSRRQMATSYRSHFKQRYQVETAWRIGGHVDTRQITPDQGVVTSLHLTSDYIIVALDNAKIHVFDTQGRHLRCLQGHVMGVWAMVPCGDTLVSGGCDRDVRVWDLKTGTAVHMLRGHTSTVRCLKMSGSSIAISGSRDNSLRVWDIKKGICRHILQGHLASVRCLEICGDIVVSGSYDTTARIWSISEGRCLRVLQGHFSQIYAVAFDGRRVATGSLDTSVRIWDPRDGRCLAQLQGHTSLVGQLQLRNDTLVTGGSDGSVRVWSLQTYSAIHRLAAHDNSVTSLQFDDGRIVSGGSDGRVKVWDLQTGQLVRELGSPAEAVWRVVFEEEKAVVLASRSGKTVMEVWSFAPPPDSENSPAAPTIDVPPSTSSSSASADSSPTASHFNYSSSFTQVPKSTKQMRTTARAAGSATSANEANDATDRAESARVLVERARFFDSAEEAAVAGRSGAVGEEVVDQVMREIYEPAEEEDARMENASAA